MGFGHRTDQSEDPKPHYIVGYRCNFPTLKKVEMSRPASVLDVVHRPEPDTPLNCVDMILRGDFEVLPWAALSRVHLLCQMELADDGRSDLMQNNLVCTSLLGRPTPFLIYGSIPSWISAGGSISSLSEESLEEGAAQLSRYRGCTDERTRAQAVHVPMGFFFARLHRKYVNM